MKTQIYLSFNTTPRPWPVVRKLFGEAELHDMVAAGPSFTSYYGVTLGENDPRLQRLRAALSSEGIDWSERREYVYTTAELEAAPLLWFVVRTAERGSLGPKYGTEYDLSQACPLCGTGAVQISPLRLNPSEIPRKGAIFQTFDHEKLVSPELAQVITNAGVTGLTLRTAQSYRDGTDLPWVQLVSSVELPPMSSESKGIIRDDICPHCGRNGYFNSAHEPTEIKYSSTQVVLDELPDVVHTYEYFGYSKIRVPFKTSYLAHPLLLVKPKVFKLFRQQKVRGLEFVPVDIIEM
jgi:rRNA maturation protein Nop10